MRITFVLPLLDSLSGGARIIAQWAQHLHLRGHSVLLIAPPRRALTLRERVRRWRRGEFARAEKHSHYDRIAVPRAELKQYRPVVDADVPEADVVIATWWETAEWVAALAPRAGAKAYLVQGHEIFDRAHQTRVTATYHLPLQKIVVAKWLQALMREQYGDANALPVTQGVDRALFDAPPRGKQKIPTVGFMYSSHPIKGCDVMLNALAVARAQLPHLRLVAFGSEKPTAQSPLPREARFIQQPPQTMLRELYAQCDAWLFASRTEGFSLVPMEALACRTPVIGAPAGGEQELIANGGGILVPQEDANAMARAILNIAAMTETQWRALSDSAYKTIAPYTWERATDQMEAALLETLARAARANGKHAERQ
jgi:glycosyltransferase involved in cell wall biosynthesis